MGQHLSAGGQIFDDLYFISSMCLIVQVGVLCVSTVFISLSSKKMQNILLLIVKDFIICDLDSLYYELAKILNWEFIITSYLLGLNCEGSTIIKDFENAYLPH